MPIADLTGAASNALSAARSQMAVNAQRKSQLLGGVAGLADNASEMIARKKMQDELTRLGLSPELARDPHTAATAILQKQKEDKQREEQSKQVGVVNQMFPGANMPTDAGFDASTAYTIASQQAAEARRKKEREALSSAWAPQATTIPLPGIAGAPSSMSVPVKPTPMQGYERAVTGGADPQSALNIAKGFDELTPKPVEPKPWKPMTAAEQVEQERQLAEARRAPEKTPAQIKEAAKAEAEGRAAGTPAQPRNIDPLSPAGIKAQLELAEQKATLRPDWDGAKSSAAALMKSDIINLSEQIHDLTKYGEASLDAEDKKTLDGLRTRESALRKRHAKLTGYSGEDDASEDKPPPMPSNPADATDDQLKAYKAWKDAHPGK